MFGCEGRTFATLKECGEVTEWLKVHAWNACVRATVPRVRIPVSPPEKEDVDKMQERGWLRTTKWPYLHHAAQTALMRGD